MRASAFLIFLLAFSQNACAEEPMEMSPDATAAIVSEFEKFMELELRDCIAGYDAIVFQESSGVETKVDLEAAKGIIGMMRAALNSKVGEDVSLELIRETSSYHISGIYLSDASSSEQSLAHVDYQSKVIESCNRQILRIVEQVSESGKI